MHSETPHPPYTRGQRYPTPRTQHGTPFAESWDDAWVERVEAVENALGRSICGARLHSGQPCEVESEHESGRCRYHGGFELTGVPKGNRNAEIHALYSRRLRLCGAECPLWKQCPCAMESVAKLEPAKRPTCPYEQAEYDAALEEALALAATNPQPNPMAAHIAHNIAIIQVLLNRAALALRGAPLTTNTLSSSRVNPQSGAYIVETKPSAELTAFVRLAAEYRRFAALLLPGKAPRRSDAANKEKPPRPKGLADEVKEFMDANPDLYHETNPEKERLRQAQLAAQAAQSDKSDRSDGPNGRESLAPGPADTPRRSEFLRPPNDPVDGLVAIAPRLP